MSFHITTLGGYNTLKMDPGPIICMTKVISQQVPPPPPSFTPFY